jgi:hypothetical protein
MNNTNSSRLNVNGNLAKKISQSQNRYNMILLGVSIAIVILGIVYFIFSKTIRVARVTRNMNIYINFQTIESMKPVQIKDFKLADFYVCSSYNSACSGYQTFDYVSTEMVKKVLQTGCRYLEFQVFGDKFGIEGIPVVSTGYREGEWKLSLNTLYLEDVLKTIADNAFRIYDGTDGCPNNKDPLFISLDLKTNYNHYLNNKILKLFTKYLANFLLDPSYNYQAKNIALTHLKDLMGKVIIFSSDGFQGSGLEEIVNYSLSFTKIKRLHHTEIDNEMSVEIGIDLENNKSRSKILNENVSQSKQIIETNQLIQDNKNGLSIVIPHKEGDFLTRNYDPDNAWKLGCQFVSMNFQLMDTNMDKYINKFKKRAFVLKPRYLR